MRPRESRGFSLIELMMVVAIMGVLVAITVPMSGNAIRFLKLSGDAREISNAAAVAKMRAAAKFTQSRLFIDVTGRNFYIQTYTRVATASCAVGVWCTEGGATNLSNTVTFGFGPVSTPPPNTQTTINQAAMCQTTDATPVDIANTACVIFNSRGIPVDNTGSPTGVDAVYVTDGSAVYGITIAATGFIRTWQTNHTSTPSWTLQ
jgi:prepilin-type N-terminal cleavage/methylation domain-containing protein